MRVLLREKGSQGIWTLLGLTAFVKLDCRPVSTDARGSCNLEAVHAVYCYAKDGTGMELTYPD